MNTRNFSLTVLFADVPDMVVRVGNTYNRAELQGT